MTSFFNPQVRQTESSRAELNLPQPAHEQPTVNMPAIVALASVIVAFAFFSTFGTSDAADECWVLKPNTNCPDLVKETCGDCVKIIYPDMSYTWKCNDYNHPDETATATRTYTDRVEAKSGESGTKDPAENTIQCVLRQVCESVCVPKAGSSTPTCRLNDPAFGVPKTNYTEKETKPKGPNYKCVGQET